MPERKVGLELRALLNLTARYFSKSGRPFPENLTEMQMRVLGYLLDRDDQAVVQRDLEKAFTIRKSTASKMLLQIGGISGGWRTCGTPGRSGCS